MDGRSNTILGLVLRAEDGGVFICNSCLSSGASKRCPNLRSASSAFNLYKHLGQIHSEIYTFLLPIVQISEKNKKRGT